MQSPCVRETSQTCLYGCCPASFLSLAEAFTDPKPRTTATAAAAAATTTTTIKATRSNFAVATTTILFPDTHFTNHESLPTLSEAFSNFVAAYPHYAQTEQTDYIRQHEYYHLSNYICLDYSGFGLFSHAQLHTSIASSSSPRPSLLPPPLSPRQQSPSFNISYKSASLKAQVQYGSQETEMETVIRKRIMKFLNISEDDYGMVCTANRTSAFKLLAESYPFQTNRRVLTVYDYESEAVNAMVESSQKRGAKIMSANFSWPGLRIHSAKLKKMVVSKRKKKKRGLFVFPLQSKITGTRYPYLWMRLAQENGWHVVLDACALGPKDMDTLGLSLFQPDFLICSFFKVFGENPSGFGCLSVKRSSSSLLEGSVTARSIGIVSIVPARSPSRLPPDYSGIDSDTQAAKLQSEEDEVETTRSFSGPLSGPISGPISALICNGSPQRSGRLDEKSTSVEQKQVETFEQGESSKLYDSRIREQMRPVSSEIVELGKTKPDRSKASAGEVTKSMKIECRGLDHADSLGLLLISSRLRYIINWLVNALMKLQHPHSENGHPLVRIYGPRVKFERGPAVAFNVFDWKGEKVEPALVQKLADRSNISLSCGFLNNIWFSDKYEGDRDAVIEKRVSQVAISANKKERIDFGIDVVNASLSFLASFEDAYRLWAFVAKFLDADFVEKERWRYMALNQKMVEV